ncbi:MAG: hypothetical protein IKJ28_07155, partial [Alphaproteobacteria bacterium]|nr:hypothetical protein [Alphaproteobacteria bacterium]
GNSCVTCGTNQQVNETQNGCECKTNWHGEGCTTYCDTSVASMSSGTCVCEDKTTYWNGQACESCGANKVYENGSCVCNNQSYADGDSCIQCPSGSTPISGGCDCDGDGNWNGSSCITCDTNATFKDNGCVCNTGYYGSGTSCTECKKPFQTFDNNTICRCPDGTHEEEGRCEPNDDGSGGVTNLCEAGWVWDSEEGKCAACPEGYIVQEGECVEDVSTFCTTAMTTAGFSTSNFEMDSDGKTIKYTGNMTVANDLDISGCDLNVAGELYISKGKTLKVKNVYGKSLSDSGINNHGGTIIANGNVRGISSQNFGIRNDEGIIKSQGIVIGTSSDEYGIRNDEGTIKAINVKGTSDINYGIVNEGSISASGDVLGIGNGSRAGIINTGSISKITATNVYYCKTIIDKGMIIGNIKCASGCTCTN